MKITDIIWEKQLLELYEPFKIAFTECYFMENIIIKVTTDESIVGYGEAAPFLPVTGETAESVISVLEILKPGLIGVDPFDIDYIHSFMDKAVYGNGSAKCAVDTAMYDIMGKATGKPIHKLLGGFRTVIQNDITIGIDKPEIMADMAERHVKENGFGILKIKAGLDPDQDVHALSLIRSKVGRDIRLRVDANQGYDVAKALKAIEGFKKSGVEAVEQCLPYWDCEGAALLRNKVTGIKLMLDESIHGVKDAQRFVRAGGADILNIKLMKCGGMFQGLKISDIAESSGVQCMVGCMMETRIGITAGLSLIAARKNITEADCDSFMFYEDKTGITGGFIRDKDQFTLLDKPGLGIDISF
ncbi:mandelate racemase/muconate lactonizing enzyme family protein [Fusibacter ferrireducens]|uniref:Dipeptide epimerase n=1 Tax=Fusibacter ferrireducens TaxID=2785058 RepID=A0ABR9ZPD4_9FIRM|nr:dipeptide epimerase [Fusibacter ferrireducens]MBF4692330.1 dipeptide epimerase [Fusibacter ferrireducens]